MLAHRHLQAMASRTTPRGSGGPSRLLALLLVLAASCQCAPPTLRWDALRKSLQRELHTATFLAGLQEEEGSAGVPIPYCTTCKLSTATLLDYLRLGLPDSVMMSLLRSGCRRLSIETPRVCDGLVDRFKDEFFYVLRRTTLSSAEICGIVFPDECPSGGAAVNWTVPLPERPKPPVRPVPLPKEGAPTLRVLHISDTHVDFEYAEGSEADCNEPLCCHAGDRPKSRGLGRRPAGKWGAFETCDIPAATFEHMLKTVRDTQKIDYVVWTGDLVPHNIWNTSRSGNLDAMRYTVEALQKYLPDVPVYPALGNHEGNPADSFPTPAIQGDRSIAWLYNALASTWSKWLPQTTTLTTKRGAYYAAKPFPGLKIISLNMNYCNNMNWWLLLDPRDPAEQLTFLVNELQESEINGEKVHIIGHIPPGLEDCLQVWSTNYNRIIARFESTVRAQFFGHTHQDELQVFYEGHASSYAGRHSRRPLGLAYVAPSTTTFNTGHPAFRIYVVDGNYSNSSWAVLDHETYLMNLTELDANPSREPSWKLEYTAKAAYGMHSLQPADWDHLLERMERDDALFDLFYRFYTKQNPLAAPCDAACRKSFLCKQRTSESAELHNCK